MSDDFVKIYGAILDSSIWREPDPTRILWFTLLIMADPTGFVEASVGGLAARARISREACEVGLETLASPDPDSKSENFEGRRIEKVEGGWLILNHTRYRERRSRRQQQTADRVRRWRERHAAPAPETKAAPTRSTRPQLDALAVPLPPELQTAAFEAEWRTFVEYRKRLGKPFKTENGPSHALKLLAPLGSERAVLALKITREEEWQGVKYGIAELEAMEAKGAASGRPHRSPAAARRRAEQEVELGRRKVKQRAFADKKLTTEQRDSIVEASERATSVEDLERILWPT